MLVVYVSGGLPSLQKMVIRIWPVNLYGMNPNAAIGFILISLAALLCSLVPGARWRATGIALCGSAAAALGLYGLAGQLTGLQTTYGLGSLTGMRSLTAFGLVVLGAGVLAISWREGRYVQTDRHSWILVVVSMAGIVITTSLWQALLLVEELHLESAAQLRSDLAGAVLIFGVLATALLVAAIYRTQTTHSRLSVAERLRKQAEQEVAERKLAQKELARANAYNRSLIEASLDPLVTISPAGIITDVNHATEEVTRCPRHELIGTDFSSYFTDAETARLGYQKVFREGSVRDYELEIRGRDGRTTPVLYNASVFKNESGEVEGVFAAARDLAERKRAEQEVRKLTIELEARVAARTDELRSANKELEMFNYAVAHDLRAPLRRIHGFVDILAEEAGPGLDNPAKRHLAMIQDSVQHMGQLLEDLLSLSRMGRQELRKQSCGLNSIVDEVVTELKAEIQNREIEWRIAELPAVNCDPALMKQVLVNLLSNALKFTRTRQPAVIDIGQTTVDGEAAIFVRDNGVGFSMKYADKLFGVFQRLHRQQDFEGTGVGLAIVQRIVNRHGGRVWAEAEINKGATFYFTLHCRQIEKRELASAHATV